MELVYDYLQSGLVGLSDFQSRNVPFRLTIKINRCVLTIACKGQVHLHLAADRWRQTTGSRLSSLQVLLVTFFLTPNFVHGAGLTGLKIKTCDVLQENLKSDP